MHAHAYYLTYMSQREQKPFSTSSSSREGRMKGPFVLLCTLKVGLQVGPGEKPWLYWGVPSLNSVEGKCLKHMLIKYISGY